MSKCAPSWRTTAIRLLWCVLLTGCAKALLVSNPPSLQKLRISSPHPEEYKVVVTGGDNYSVPPNGRVQVQIPRLPSGDATYVLGVKVASASSYDVPALQVNADGRAIRKLSLNDLSKLPVDEEGFHVLTIPSR
jgi:hypothetical protein